MSRRTDVRIVLLRRHVLDDLLPLRGSRPHAAGLGCGGLWPLHQRLFRPVRLRRPGRLRHPAGQVGCPHHGIRLRGHDDRGSGSGPVCHHGGLPPGAFAAPRLRGLHVLRAGQRDRRDGRHPLHREMVPPRAHGPGDGPAAGDCPAGHSLRARPRAAPRHRTGRTRLYARRDGPPGDGRAGPDGSRAGPLGRIRGDGRAAGQGGDPRSGRG